MSEQPTLKQLQQAVVSANSQGLTDEANQIAVMLENLYPQDAKALVNPMYEPENLHGDMVESVSNIPTEIADSLSQYANPETYSGTPTDDPMYSNPITATANVARPALGVVGSVATAGWDTWWNTFGRAFPEDSKADVEQGYKDLTSGLVERWDAFSEQYPLEARMIEDTGTAAELMGGRLPVPNLNKQVRKTGDAAKTADIEARRQGLYKMLRTKDSEGTVDESSTSTGRRELWTPDANERNMATTLETIDSVDPGRSYRFNFREVQKAVQGWGKDLVKVVKSHHKKRIQKTELLNDFDAAFDDVPNLPGYNVLTPDAQKLLGQYISEARRLINAAGTKNTLRPLDLLNIRKEFDALFTSGGGKLGAEAGNARSLAAQELRNVLGDKLRAVTGDPNVHNLLDTQHEGLKAMEVLRPKRDAEADSGLKRIGQYLKELGHLPATPLALYATGAAVASAGAPAIAGAAAVGATGVTAYQIYKGMTGPGRKKAVAKLLAELNKLGKDNPKVLDDLAVERAMLIEMLKEPYEEDE